MSVQIQRPFSTKPRAIAAKFAPARLWLPRNARSIIEARAAGDMPDRATFIVSFVDSTVFAGPHVFVDGGRRYDWRWAAGLHACIVARRGIDARPVMEGLREVAAFGMAPYLIDLDSQVVATIVCNRPLTLAPEPRGSYLWRQVFS